MHKTKNEYDTCAHIYEKKWGSYMKNTYQKIREKLDFCIEGDKPIHLLEIGAGTGYGAKMILENYPTLHYTGVELSGGMLARAYEKLSIFSEERYEVHHTDFLKRESKETYDIIISNSVLHFMDYEKALKKLSSHMKPGGVFIIEDRSNDGWFRIKQWWISVIFRSGLPSLSYDCMEKLCRNVGLERKHHKKRREGGFIMQLIDNVDDSK